MTVSGSDLAHAPLTTAVHDWRYRAHTPRLDAIWLVPAGRVSHSGKGAGMSDPLDVQQTLDHCMLTIRGASEAMSDDMLDAAMRLGAAEMMLASARYAVHKRVVQLLPAQTRLDAGEQPAGS